MAAVATECGEEGREGWRAMSMERDVERRLRAELAEAKRERGYLAERVKELERENLELKKRVRVARRKEGREF